MNLIKAKYFFLVLIFLLIIACNEKTKIENKSQEIQDTLAVDSKNTFLFLTEWFNKVGVFRYDLVKKKYKPVWWHPRENVVMLVYKPGNFPSYFLTSEKIGNRNSFPSFSGLKLFIISQDLSETKQIDDIGDGIQFSALWNEDANLEVIFTQVDLVNASYVNQFTKVFDHYGKLIDSGIKTYDIQKSGFPELIPPRNSTVSPSGKSGATFKGDSVFLKIAGTDSLEFIAVLNHPLNKLKWDDDENYLFISTLDLDNVTVKTPNPETSELLIYSLSADSLIGQFAKTGIKNFFTMNDLLIFDDGFESNSVINIFNLNQKKIIDVIKPRSGCGLVVFPQL